MSSQNMNHHHLVNNIQSSQQNEKSLYLDLERLPQDPNSFETQKEIIEKIYNSSQSRVSLFRQLNIVYGLMGDNVTNNKLQLKDQMELLNMMETHLKKSKSELSRNKNLNVSNLRMTEINTYYSDKYRAQYAILRQIILLCLPVLIIAILRSRQIISSNISGFLVTIVFIIGVFVVVPRIIDLNSRNNMVFSEYDFPFNPNEDAPAHSNQESESGLLKKWNKDLKLLEEGECIGPACCGKGMIYDNKKEVCIINQSSKREAFLGSQSSNLIGSELNNPDTMSKTLISTDKSGKYYSV